MTPLEKKKRQNLSLDVRSRAGLGTRRSPNFTETDAFIISSSTHHLFKLNLDSKFHINIYRKISVQTTSTVLKEPCRMAPRCKVTRLKNEKKKRIYDFANLPLNHQVCWFTNLPLYE